jgi:hypothetical protein
MKHRIVSILAASTTLAVAATALAGTFWFEASPNQRVTAIGKGHSCALLSPKKKAEDEARQDAYDHAIVKCNITSAECRSECIAEGGDDGSRTLLDEVYDATAFSEGSDCGWDAETRVVGDCGCLCDF